MIVGVHNMLDALSRYWHERVSSDGALWIVFLDGLLLIPLIFAVFFYPKIVLIGVGAVLLLTLAAWELVHYYHTHHVMPDRWYRHH